MTPFGLMYQLPVNIIHLCIHINKCAKSDIGQDRSFKIPTLVQLIVSDLVIKEV